MDLLVRHLRSEGRDVLGKFRRRTWTRAAPPTFRVQNAAEETNQAPRARIVPINRLAHNLLPWSRALVVVFPVARKISLAQPPGLRNVPKYCCYGSGTAEHIVVNVPVPVLFL